jgi:hypothetical protein
MDTLRIADELERAGFFSGDKARAFARIIADAAQESLATKQDIKDLGTTLRSEMSVLTSELRATLYRALFIQFLAVVGTMAAIIKL